MEKEIYDVNLAGKKRPIWSMGSSTSVGKNRRGVEIGSVCVGRERPIGNSSALSEISVRSCVPRGYLQRNFGQSDSLRLISTCFVARIKLQSIDPEE